VSDLVGCQRDLVLPGETGWVFPAGDAAALEAALRRALTTPPAELARLRRNVAARISGYTYEQTTQGLFAALASLPRTGPA
jgi:glycosyltransferase involved in cell wall biosynthesis